MKAERNRSSAATGSPEAHPSKATTATTNVGSLVALAVLVGFAVFGRPVILSHVETE